MKRIDRKHMTWSLLFCILIPLFIPRDFVNESMGRYTYGFPLNYITIYQHEPNSGWFFDNFFSGNAGLAINLGTFVINVLIIYLIVRFVVNKLMRKKDTVLNVIKPDEPIDSEKSN
ncbi:hypothetical protein VBD025_15425 [Virgibacillus flavescens]|uniref:hypothetical protein n=1 Tax=Virgibacillus flavescens TaxID=1611422 RepID=UPI003D354B05